MDQDVGSFFQLSADQKYNQSISTDQLIAGNKMKSERKKSHRLVPFHKPSKDVGAIVGVNFSSETLCQLLTEWGKGSSAHRPRFPSKWRDWLKMKWLKTTRIEWVDSVDAWLDGRYDFQSVSSRNIFGFSEFSWCMVYYLMSLLQRGST